MSVLFADIVTPLTRDQVVTVALGIFASAAFPTTAWGETDEPRGLIEYDAEVLAGLSQDIANVGLMGLTSTATGAGLTLHAKEFYQEQRKLAQQTVGAITLTESAGTPYPYAAGELVITTTADPDVIFRNVTAVTGNPNTAVTFSIAAEKPGAAYNVDASTLRMASPVPGLALSAASGGSWRTVDGADEEADESLRVRLTTKFATFASTGPTDSYVKHALDSDPTITRVRVQEDPLAVPPAFAVTVIVASASGVPTAAALTAAVAAIQLRRPLGTLVQTIAAVAYVVSLRGTVRVRAAYRQSAEQQINASLAAYFSSLAIGGQMFVSELIERVMAAGGVLNFTPMKADGVTPMLPGTDDVTPSLSGVATLSLSLTYVSV